MAAPQNVPRQPATQQTYQKRERKMLKITDPTTGEEINVGAGKTSTPPQSGSSSSRATPVASEVSLCITCNFNVLINKTLDFYQC